MKMRIKILLTLTIICITASAHAVPGPRPDAGPAPAPFNGRGPAPRLNVLPDIATTLILGGLTYYVVNDVYYRKEGDVYIRVETPQSDLSGLNTVDYNGKRYYSRNGHYYQRDIDGNYYEVPRPSGL